MGERAFISYRAGEKGAEHRWCNPRFGWWTGAEVDKDAAEAEREARGILEVTERGTSVPLNQLFSNHREILVIALGNFGSRMEDLRSS